jgi:hypothetical protein
MSVRAIVLNKDSDVTAHAVPLAAVLQEEDNYFVFGTDSEAGSDKLRIKKYKVNLGDKDENFTEIVFPNAIPANLTIAQNNVAALEMQRKQMSGAGL